MPAFAYVCQGDNHEFNSWIPICPECPSGYLLAMAEPLEQTIAWSWNGAEVILGQTRAGQRPARAAAAGSELDLDPRRTGAAAGAPRGPVRDGQHRLAGFRRPAAAPGRLDAGDPWRFSRVCAPGGVP